jgi:hypothetical protein
MGNSLVVAVVHSWCAFLVLQGFAQPLYAEVSDGRVSCLASRDDNRPHAKRLPNGYETSVGPSVAAADPSERCTGAIRDPGGNAVFRTDGFNVILDEELTGQDFDGDGKGEVVFRTDTGGGQHCCWSYNVVTLFPKPRKLFDIDAAGMVSFEKDKDGKMVIWQRVPGPDGYADMADRPFAERVFRVRESKLVDCTPEFCPRILAPGNADYDEQMRVLTPNRLKRLRRERGMPDQKTASALLSRALQSTLCRRYDDALMMLNQWPEASRRRVKSDFGQLVREDHPSFAARLLGK